MTRTMQRLYLALMAAIVVVILWCASLALADPPPVVLHDFEDLPIAAPVVAPTATVPDLATLPDCISQGAANAALACVTGKAPPAVTDRVTFWATWGASLGSTLLSVGLGLIVDRYDPIGK